MSIIIIILIVLGALILLYVTRFLSRTFKIVAKLILILIIGLVVLTLLVYKDMSQLKKGFIENNNTFFLYENNKLYSAVTLKPLTKTELSIDSFNYFTEKEIELAEGYLNKKDCASLLKENYRIFILNPSIINKSYTLDLGKELNQDDLFSIIMSKDPFMTLAEKTQQGYNMSIQSLKSGFLDMFESEQKLKGYLFAGLLSNYFHKQRPGELTRNFKDKNLVVYPETISFKIIKHVPWV